MIEQWWFTNSLRICVLYFFYLHILLDRSRRLAFPLCGGLFVFKGRKTKVRREKGGRLKRYLMFTS